MFCHKCGTQVSDGVGFCQKCGTPMVYVADVQSPMDESPAITEQSDANEKPIIAAPTYSGGMMNDLEAFKAYVDNHVRATTSFQSAAELLNSHVPQKFLWKCFGIPTILAIILFIRLPSVQNLFAAAFLVFLFGYPAALLVDFFKSCVAKGSIERTIETIDSDELIQFLNGHLNYLSPYFHEWDYINYRGVGVRGAAMAHVLNSVTASASKIGTEFGHRQRCFVVIWIEPDEASSESEQPKTKYYFDTAMKSIVPSKYVCMVKTVPILQAAMEYYLKNCRGGKDNVLF